MYYFSRLASSVALVFVLFAPVCSFAGELPESWHPFGDAEFNWPDETARTGGRAASVESAAPAELAGWSQMISVRHDREYVFSVWAKAGEMSVAPGGHGAVAAIVFLDANREPFAESVMAPLQRNLQQWTQLKTPPARAPQGAFFARLVAGVHQTQGRVWFDDVRLDIEPVAGAAEPNLIENGDFEKLDDKGVLLNWHGNDRRPIKLRGATVAGEGMSVDRTATDDGNALRIAVDRRGHTREDEPKIMVPGVSVVGHVPPPVKYAWTPPNWKDSGHIPVLAGASYEMSFRHRPFWQRGEGSANHYLYLRLHFRGPVSENWHRSNALIGGFQEIMHFGEGLGNWQAKQVTFAPPEGVERCFIHFGLSAWMAQAGFKGPTDALGGSRGFMRVMSDSFDSQKLFTHQSNWSIESCYYKPYAACRHCHAPIEAALLLVNENTLSYDDIDSILVETYDLAVRGHDHCSVLTPHLDNQLLKNSIHHARILICLFGI